MSTLDPTPRTGRAAGALYLLIGLTAPFSLLYVPSTLIVRGDAAATARNILGHEMLFRAGMAAHLASMVAFIYLVVVLYRLLHRVDATQAALMVILALVSAPMSFSVIQHELAALNLLQGAGSFAALGAAQQQTFAMLMLGLRGPAFVVAEAFWGFWLFPFGLLVMRSGFLPRLLGAWLLLNGAAYVVITATALLLPQYGPLVDRMAKVPQLGELAIMLWLLVKGARVGPTDAAAAASPAPA